MDDDASAGLKKFSSKPERVRGFERPSLILLEPTPRGMDDSWNKTHLQVRWRPSANPTTQPPSDLRVFANPQPRPVLPVCEPSSSPPLSRWWIGEPWMGTRKTCNASRHLVCGLAHLRVGSLAKVDIKGSISSWESGDIGLLQGPSLIVTISTHAWIILSEVG